MVHKHAIGINRRDHGVESFSFYRTDSKIRACFKAVCLFGGVYALAAYFCVFMVLSGLLFVWQTSRRHERPPEKFKLLRGPGETQRRRVQAADEKLFSYLFGGAFIPLFAGWSIIAIALYLPKTAVLPVGAVAAAVFVGGIIVAIIIVLRFMQRRRDDLLGYLGERAVAEHLAQLSRQGYRIFHNVPAEGRSRDFNIDHVVVGPTGVSAIEVKTRRKKKGRPGREEHVVTYDGQRFIWPWGEDRCGIEQVQAEADWLAEFIEKRTALKVQPKPIIAFPGWLVRERTVGAFRVANHKLLPNIVAQWRPQTLSAEQVDLISRQLDEQCRDVED